MSYMTIMNIANSHTLQQRIQAAAAQESTSAGVTLPGGVPTWVLNNMLTIAATSGWSEKWDYAVDTATVNVNPDTGARIDVISDGDILQAVQPLVLALKPEVPGEVLGG